ncbi:MAG: hypothetical protein ACRDSJ_12165 [Rubrobacteraceae bacterium]
MSRHGRLAVGGAVVAAAVALPGAVAVGWYLGEAEAWSFLYGVVVGLATFSTIAVAVPLIFGQTTDAKKLIGAGIYAGRIVFAIAAVAVPITLDLWPIMPMVCGLVGVYIVENVVLLPAAARSAGDSSIRRTEG